MTGPGRTPLGPGPPLSPGEGPRPRLVSKDGARPASDFSPSCPFPDPDVEERHPLSLPPAIFQNAPPPPHPRSRSCSHRPFCPCRLLCPPPYAASGRSNMLHTCLLPISPNVRHDPHVGSVQPSPTIPPALPLLLWGNVNSSSPPFLPPRPQSRISLDPRRQHGAREAAARSSPARACQHRGELQV